MKHLHPTFMTFQLAAVPATPTSPAYPARTMRVRVEYSHHCFSHGNGDPATFNPDHVYGFAGWPNDKLRVFCPVRWEASRELPGLIQNLTERNCYSTRRANYFAVKRHGEDSHYVFYFETKRGPGSGLDVRMTVTSAHHRQMQEQINGSAATSFADILFKSSR